ncbi:MAG: hypothetical protein WAL29_05750 [Bacteroidales bacterium]
MSFLHNIRTVSLYEAKTLRRSWFFRLFSIGALVILTFMNIGLFSPIGDEPWELIAIPSNVPLINLYLLNIGQAIIVIFLAADFLKRDKKLDTNEVLYTRSMSNFEYITGKTIGILRLFLGLDLVILSIGLLMNIISKSMTIDLMSYLSYLLIICVPTIVFSLGLAFMLMQVIRNQAITFMILLGYAALDMFYLYYRAGSIFDYMAFGLPVYKSGMIGFDNLEFIINQRLLYFFLGMALVMGTILLFNRLPQSKIQRALTIVLLTGFTGCAIITGSKTWSSYINKVSEKKLVIETNRQFENEKFQTISEERIEFTHKGSSIEASADIKIFNSNNQPLEKYLFSLNPGLVVTRITSGSGELPYTLTNHIIVIDPGKKLEKDQTDSLKIFYSGTISESFCYPDYSDNLKENYYRGEMLNINKRQVFLTDDYVLLTPESYWYPVAALNYYPSNPAKIKIDFTRYTLNVHTKNGLKAISQGRPGAGNGDFSFRPELPLTGLTLAIGNYQTDTLTVDSIEYISYHYPGNDYYKKDLVELKDTLSLLVSGIMRELETNFSTKYPFKTLSILEVPVQYYSYPKRSTQTRAELQPSMVLVPERLVTLQDAGFRQRFTRQKKRMARNNQVITDKELQVRVFNDFVRNTFISGERFRYVNGAAWNEPVRYRLGPSFYFFKNNFHSEVFPVINAVFETHLQKVTQPSTGYNFFDFSGSLSDNDRANLVLKDKSFKDLLAKNPGGDTIRTILTLKGDYLFNLLRSKAGIEEFKNWFSKYIDDNTFKSVDISDMNEDIKQKFGFEFYPYLDDWFNGKGQPGFLFSDLQATEIIIGNRVRYQVTFTASNPEPVSGLFNVSVRQGDEAQRTDVMVSRGPGGGTSIAISGQGRGMEAGDIAKIVFLGPLEAKKIALVLDGQPREVLINALVARNIPGEITLPVEEIAKAKNRNTELKEEETLTRMPDLKDPFETIVDNEDPGFNFTRQSTESPLKKILGVQNRNGQSYEQIRLMRAPEHWQPVVQSSYFGKYIRSSVYTRSGTGDRILTWKAAMSTPGYYDIYTYIGKANDGTVVRMGMPGPPPPPGEDERGGTSPCRDLHFKIYHDQGTEEITLEYENAESGWNNLGRYYLSSDTATVEMTNQSIGNYVIGDAVKWVLQK